jgi:hypothetical protein
MYRVEDYPQIKNNFFLGSKNAGASKKLLGEVNIVTVFMKRPQSPWSSRLLQRYEAGGELS